MNKPNKHDVIVKAVRDLKNSEYGATAVKVELEANINRYEDVDDIWKAIMQQLVHLGLATTDDDEYYEVKKPLVYLKVYDDGSVDTEMTFTLLLDNPENVFMLPEIVRIFRDVCEESGDDFVTENAGMHMSILNDANGYYNSEPHEGELSKAKPYDVSRFKNFRKSMIRLLPALYFLGSTNSTSRSLGYRRPDITRCEQSTNHRYDSDSQKYSAVAFRHGAVEFRVFETCYDNPDTILDNIVVMSKAMRFWTRSYTRNYLRPMPDRVRFGVDGNSRLERFYLTRQHIDLLHDGLNILKPDYYTINELKHQRNFTVTKKSIDSKLKEARKNAVKNYMEYERKFKWDVIYHEQTLVRDILREYRDGLLTSNDDPVEALQLAQKEAKKRAQSFKKSKEKRKDYVRKYIEQDIPAGGGRWELDDGDTPQQPQTGEGPMDNLVARYLRGEEVQL